MFCIFFRSFLCCLCLSLLSLAARIARSLSFLFCSAIRIRLIRALALASLIEEALDKPAKFILGVDEEENLLFVCGVLPLPIVILRFVRGELVREEDMLYVPREEGRGACVCDEGERELVEAEGAK